MIKITALSNLKVDDFCEDLDKTVDYIFEHICQCRRSILEESLFNNSNYNGSFRMLKEQMIKLLKEKYLELKIPKLFLEDIENDKTKLNDLETKISEIFTKDIIIDSSKIDVSVI